MSKRPRYEGLDYKSLSRENLSLNGELHQLPLPRKVYQQPQSHDYTNARFDLQIRFFTTEQREAPLSLLASHKRGELVDGKARVGK
jgi:hypothetical protein